MSLWHFDRSNPNLNYLVSNGRRPKTLIGTLGDIDLGTEDKVFLVVSLCLMVFGRTALTGLRKLKPIDIQFTRWVLTSLKPI